MIRHWKIVRFWNSDSVGWKRWPQTALSNSAAAKGVPQAATEHARLSQLARVETQRVVSARNIGDVMLVEDVGAEHREIQREVENAGPVQIEIEQRSEEHTSELQSLMRISYAVFCLKKKMNNSAKQNDY